VEPGGQVTADEGGVSGEVHGGGSNGGLGRCMAGALLYVSEQASKNTGATKSLMSWVRIALAESGGGPR
jgi:hypothetical protein